MFAYIRISVYIYKYKQTHTHKHINTVHTSVSSLQNFIQILGFDWEAAFPGYGRYLWFICLCWFRASLPFLSYFEPSYPLVAVVAVKGTGSLSRRKRRMISNFLWLGKWERWHPSSGSISWPSRRRDRIFSSTRPSYPWSEYFVCPIVGVFSLPVAGQVNTPSAH